MRIPAILLISLLVFGCKKSPAPEAVPPDNAPAAPVSVALVGDVPPSPESPDSSATEDNRPDPFEAVQDDNPSPPPETEEQTPSPDDPMEAEKPSTPPEEKPGNMPGDAKPQEEKNIPEGFPLPIPQGARVLQVARTPSEHGSKAVTIRLAVLAESKDVADFFEQALKDNSMQVLRRDHNYDTFSGATIHGSSETESVHIEIDRKAGDKEVQVLIQWQAKEVSSS